jgi:hypothetical protein
MMFILFSSVNENEITPWLKKLVLILSKYRLGIFCINGILYQVIGSISTKLLSEMTFSFSEIIIIKFLTWFLLLSVYLFVSILLERIGLKKVVC